MSSSEPPELNAPTEPDVGVVRFQTRPGRFVFAERDNVDGWIATDLAVDPQP